METNESIIARDIVSLGDRKIVGTVKGLTVDCDSMAVDHYLATSTSTASSLVLPFEKALGVGDAFITIQAKEDFYGSDSAEAKKIEQGAYRLLEAAVFSRGGNTLGKVKSYEYDTTFGTVTSIALDNDQVFDAESFMFFTPEFVFVDDGVEIAYDLRQKDAVPDADADSDIVVVEEVEIVPEEADPEIDAIEDESLLEEELKAEIAEEAEEAVGSDEAEPEADEAEAGNDEAEEADEAEAGSDEAEEADEAEAEAGSDEAEAGNDEAELKEFLVGQSLNADVASTDGEFKVEKGTVLTKEIVEEAAKHDALLKLTMSVDA